MITINESSGLTIFPEIENLTIKKISSFRHLGSGWHYGEGDPIEESVIQDALRFHNQILALGFLQTDAFPGLEGDVTITAYRGQECFDFTLHPEGTIDYVRECDGEEIECREGLSSAEAIAALREIGTQTWMSFASSIFNITNVVYVDSSPRFLISTSTEGGFPLLTVNALSSRDVLSASTSANITP